LGGSNSPWGSQAPRKEIKKGPFKNVKFSVFVKEGIKRISWGGSHREIFPGRRKGGERKGTTNGKRGKNAIPVKKEVIEGKPTLGLGPCRGKKDQKRIPVIPNGRECNHRR